MITMVESKRRTQIGSTATFDTGLIFSRVMRLITTRDIEVEYSFCYEFAPILTSLFADIGDQNKVCLEKETAGGAIRPNLAATRRCHHRWVCYSLDYSLAISGYSARFGEWFLAVHPGEVELQ